MALSTIVVGCDLSVPSDHALERALAIAERHRAALVLVHAQADDAPLEIASPSSGGARSDAERRGGTIDNEMLKQLGEVSAAVRAHDARALADRLARVEARGLRGEVVSRVGPPDEVLAATAEERGAALIVMGSHGHTGIARLLLGSVASSTIRRVTCDILICRGPATPSLFRRPLVATDFSAVAAKAIARAALVAEPAVPFDVVHAWQLPTGSWGATLLGQARFPWSTVRDAVLASARSLADALVAEHADLGHPLHVELVQGPPASVVTHAAERNGNDLIAVGAHGRRGVRRLLLGSVAESTIRHSPCSVLVIHSDAA